MMEITANKAVELGVPTTLNSEIQAIFAEV
jgi:hypothetical protein